MPIQSNTTWITAVGAVRLFIVHYERPTIKVFHLGWREQIPFLAKLGYRVVVPTLRGFGETVSSRSRETPRTADYYQNAGFSYRNFCLWWKDNLRRFCSPVRLSQHSHCGSCWSRLGWYAFIDNREVAALTKHLRQQVSPHGDLLSFIPNESLLVSLSRLIQ